MLNKTLNPGAVILIVEDQLADARALHELVRDLGAVHIACDGPSALERARQCKPDVVLLDIEMYGMNGFAVCQALKSDPKLCDAAVIFVTSHGQTDNELLALEYGGIDFIQKPLNIPVARAHIKAHITLRVEAKKLANHDALTGLPNRNLLQDRTEQALQKAYRSNGRVAMLLLDLDNFKGINDSVGHSLGDEMLKEAALRLSQAARAVDTVSRQGGDEFIILLPEVGSFDAVGEFANRLLATIGRPFLLRARGAHGFDRPALWWQSCGDSQCVDQLRSGAGKATRAPTIVLCAGRCGVSSGGAACDQRQRWHHGRPGAVVFGWRA